MNFQSKMKEIVSHMNGDYKLTFSTALRDEIAYLEFDPYNWLKISFQLRPFDKEISVDIFGENITNEWKQEFDHMIPPVPIINVDIEETSKRCASRIEKRVIKPCQENLKILRKEKEEKDRLIRPNIELMGQIEKEFKSLKGKNKKIKIERPEEECLDISLPGVVRNIHIGTTPVDGGFTLSAYNLTKDEIESMIWPLLESLKKSKK